MLKDTHKGGFGTRNLTEATSVHTLHAYALPHKPSSYGLQKHAFEGAGKVENTVYVRILEHRTAKSNENIKKDNLMIGMTYFRLVCTCPPNSILKSYYLYLRAQFRCHFYYEDFAKYPPPPYLQIAWDAPLLCVGIFILVLLLLCYEVPFTYLLMDSRFKTLSLESWNLGHSLLYLKNSSTVLKTAGFNFLF